MRDRSRTRPGSATWAWTGLGLAFGDADAIGSWLHEDPIDGLADVVFWGRSEAEAASVHDAPLLDIPGESGVYGWTDLSAAGRDR